MEDVRPFAPEERDELEQTAQVAPRAQWPSDMLERNDAGSGTPRRFQQWTGTVRGDDDVELLDERGEQRGHVRLSSAGLGERDDDQDPGALSHSSPRGGNPTTPFAVALGSQQVWPLVAGLIAVSVFLVWAHEEGGYAQTAWYPAAFVFLVLAAVVSRSRFGSLPRPLLWAVALFGVFTLWSFLSITWADAKGDAWDGANRTLLFFTVYTLFAFLPWRPRDAALLLGVLATGTAAVGSWVFLAGAESGVSEGRFTDPVGYANANAALFLAAFWPAAVLASRRETPWPVRGLFLAVAGLLLEFGVLAQSRGSLPAFALALVLYIALVPDRARSLVTLFSIGVATALSLVPLLEVFRADPGQLPQALAAARTALILTAVFLAAAGAAIGLLERRRGHLRMGARTRRVVVGVLLVIGLAAAVTIVSSGPTSRLSGGLASGRYDLWRVAALEFAGRPIQGVGADNFAVGYARERHGREEPLYPHSIELRLLSQTGLVGTGLFVGFLAFAVGAALRSRRIDATRAALASAGLVSFSYWFAHGSIDWFWEIPALGAPAFAVLGLAGGLSPVEPGRVGRARRPPRAILSLAAAGLAAASVSYALPWLAARDVEAAVAGWRTDPAFALDRLERARRINVLSSEPDVVAGVLARRLGDRERASEAFRRALDRAPSDWYPRVELAVLELEAGRRTAAVLHLEDALRLNPLEPTTRALLALARRNEPVPASLVERLDRRTVPSPFGRRPVDCRPFLGLSAVCAEREGRP
jgi:tetratricopeptide (TPR) repeat protein